MELNALYFDHPIQLPQITVVLCYAICVSPSISRKPLLFSNNLCQLQGTSCCNHRHNLLRNFAGDELYVVCMLLAVTEDKYSQPNKMDTKRLKGEVNMFPLKIGLRLQPSKEIIAKCIFEKRNFPEPLQE